MFTPPPPSALPGTPVSIKPAKELGQRAAGAVANPVPGDSVGTRRRRTAPVRSRSTRLAKAAAWLPKRLKKFLHLTGETKINGC